jgi:hypothetical protein
LSYITKETYHGGAVRIISTTTLTSSSPRVISYHGAAPINVTLPDPATIPTSRRGAFHHHICNHGTSTLEIRRHTGVAILTLASGTAASVTLGAAGYACLPRTLGVARTVYGPPRAAVANPAPRPTYSPACFVGTLCDLAAALGALPLDGEDGRDKCIIPMCIDNISHARNASREPIRAADLVMPSIIPLKFPRADFFPDPAHPLAATVLPEAAYAALSQNETPIGLEYVGKLLGADAVTRNPFHLRLKGTGTSPIVWAHGTGVSALSVTKHLWRKLIDYTGADGTTRQLDIRFVVEHTVNPEPSVLGVGGGTMNENHGAWGAIFMIYVFTNELLPSFVDGNTNTPPGAPGPITFRRSDPFVSGAAFGVSSNAANKFMHPQLLLAGALPCSFHAPMGYSWIPVGERRLMRGQGVTLDTRAKNYEFERKLRNGAPWTDPLDCTSIPFPRATIDFEDIAGNVVFGNSIGTNNYAAMSLGGGFPKSKPLEFICWENGIGDGKTYLAPLLPGWQEACGFLDVPGGSSGEIEICTDDKYGLDDGTGRREWPGAETDVRYLECDGHPDEPFEGIGGGHYCFNNGNRADDGIVSNCCISTLGDASASVTDVCRREYVIQGDFDGLSCIPQAVVCEKTAQTTVTEALEYEDHDYVMLGNQRLRTISFVRVLPDPAIVFADYTHIGGAGNKFVDVTSTWSTAGPTVTCSGTVGASPVKGFTGYDEPLNTVLQDTIIQARFLTATTATQALASRVTVNGSFQYTGYFAQIVPTGGTNATVKISKFVDDVETVLASLLITDLNSATVDVELDSWGSEITFKWTVSGGQQRTLVGFDAEICRLLGQSGLAIMSTGTLASYSNIFINDETKEHLEINAVQGWITNSLSWPDNVPNQRKSFREDCLGGPVDADCGTPPNCNCEQNSWFITGTTLTVWSVTDPDWPDGRDLSVATCQGGSDPNLGSGLDDPKTAPGAGNPRCRCQGPADVSCGSPRPPCGDCPPSFQSAVVTFPSCFSQSGQGEEPNMCKGLSTYTHSPVSCS